MFNVAVDIACRKLQSLGSLICDHKLSRKIGQITRQYHFVTCSNTMYLGLELLIVTVFLLKGGYELVLISFVRRIALRILLRSNVTEEVVVINGISIVTIFCYFLGYTDLYTEIVGWITAIVIQMIRSFFKPQQY